MDGDKHVNKDHSTLESWYDCIQCQPAQQVQPTRSSHLPEVLNLETLKFANTLLTVDSRDDCISDVHADSLPTDSNGFSSLNRCCHQHSHTAWRLQISYCMQAHYPLIQRVSSSSSDAANGTATQPGGPNRCLLQANYTGIANASYQKHDVSTFLCRGGSIRNKSLHSD